MTLKRKKRFFKCHWFWCQLHGIYKENVNKINGCFVRYTKGCEIL